MSISNPTKTSVKRIQQAIGRQDIDLLLPLLEKNIPVIDPISKKPYLMEMIEHNWWEGVYLYTKSIENEKDFILSLKDDSSRNVWHSLARVGNHWPAREFLDKYNINLEEDNSGRGAWWEWATVDWALVWIRKLSHNDWKKAWSQRDKNGLHPIEYWIDQKKWDLACWGWSHRPEITDSERLRWNEKIKYAPSRWQQSWRSWGH